MFGRATATSAVRGGPATPADPSRYAELRRLQPLVQEGGFIPELDHFVPPDVSFQDYVYYCNRRRELFASL